MKNLDELNIKQSKQMLEQLILKCKTGEKMLVMSLKYAPVMQSILCLMFSMNVAAMHCSNYSGQESKHQFAVYDSDIPVTLK